MKIQEGRIEITFTQDEKDIINKFFGEIIEEIYSNDYAYLSVDGIFEELSQYFHDGMPDKMIIK